jgi:hypothetical protein
LVQLLIDILQGDGNLYQCTDLLLLSNYTVPSNWTCTNNAATNVSSSSTVSSSGSATSSAAAAATSSKSASERQVAGVGALSLIAGVFGLLVM